MARTKATEFSLKKQVIQETVDLNYKVGADVITTFQALSYGLGDGKTPATAEHVLGSILPLFRSAVGGDLPKQVRVEKEELKLDEVTVDTQKVLVDLTRDMGVGKEAEVDFVLREVFLELGKAPAFQQAVEEGAAIIARLPAAKKERKTKDWPVATVINESSASAPVKRGAAA